MLLLSALIMGVHCHAQHPHALNKIEAKTVLHLAEGCYVMFFLINHVITDKKARSMSPFSRALSISECLG
jgi:hypothetical protein